MGNKWTECELGVFIELKRGYDLPKSARNEGSIPIISSSGFTDYNDKPMVKGPGVVTGRYGTIGEVFYSEEDFWPLNTTLYVVDFKGNDPLFVYYLLQTISYADYTDKAAVPGINRNHLHKAKVKVPISLEIQQKVAAQLYQLEKRVTLGKQINQTLEQMSQTLFKSWFVDFDPVIDNALDAGNSIPEALQSRAELRQKVRSSADFKPLPADIRALFPAEFEEMEVGWVPKGWIVEPLTKVTNIVYGKNLPKTKIVNEGYPVYGGNGIIGFYSHYLYKNPQVLISCRGAASGKVHWTKPFCFVTNNSLVIEEKNISSLYIYYSLLQQDLTNLTSGSAQPQITIANLNPVNVLLPKKEIISSFVRYAQDLQISCEARKSECETLSNLRDTLLPKLISGELSLEDFPDLIKQTEAA
ncbi:TPA: restriction endonuclease subunit S [Enterobacter roggenkampii]|nr:restriction endonuclease subunit S [Enterobacter roggenkampii]